MIIELPILRTFIKQNRDKFIFVYGNDHLDRCFLYGQPYECKDELNAWHVPVRWKCCTDSSAYIHDFHFNCLTKDAIDRCIGDIPKDGRLIIPLPKIGEGYSRMRIQAPKSWAYLKEQLDNITAKDIQYVRRNIK